MDFISSKKRSSNTKKKAQLTSTTIDAQRTSIPTSETRSKNSGPRSDHTASSKTKLGDPSDPKKPPASTPAPAPTLDVSTNSPKNSSEDLTSSSTTLPSTIKPPIHSEPPLTKALSIKKKLGAFTPDDSNSNSCLTSGGKASNDSIDRDEVNSTKNLSLNPNENGPTTSHSSCSSSQRDSLDGSSSMNAQVKRHTGHDSRWEAIQLTSSRDPPLGLSHFKLLKRLGYGDIGSVYLVELKGTDAYFAMKVMDKASIVSRNKLIRAQTEREILGLLDHPFLPTLYSHFETEKFYCLVMEYCSGGNLHSLRQKQPHKYFTEQAARFYASEVLLALEYLHMLGIVYRDLKPENVLVREEGHIMLSDFDLSLQCSVNPTLVKSSSLHGGSSGDLKGMLDADRAVRGCIQPTVFFPRRIIPKRNRKSKSDSGLGAAGLLPELIAEPTSARSMSFVGTHEYLAPEIIRGEGHGSAVDWWTLGIFVYELIYGTTPFKGSGNRATLFNVIGQPLRFPEDPVVSTSARDLIRSLLAKDPQRRIGCRRGASEIKQHQFFDGVNWALVRSVQPPHVPELVELGEITGRKKKDESGGKSEQNHASQFHFEYF